MILGTVNTANNGQGVTVIVDGEESATTKKYMWLSSYYPMPGDRVLIEEIGGSYVILGKVTNNRVASAMAHNAENRIGSADSGYVALGISGGELYYGLAPADGSSFPMKKVKDA